MWGNFSDLAKIASDQASKFNLDSISNIDEEKNDTTAAATPTKTTQQPTSSSFSLASSLFNTVTTDNSPFANNDSPATIQSSAPKEDAITIHSEDEINKSSSQTSNNHKIPSSIDTFDKLSPSESNTAISEDDINKDETILQVSNSVEQQDSIASVEKGEEEESKSAQVLDQTSSSLILPEEEETSPCHKSSIEETACVDKNDVTGKENEDTGWGYNDDDVDLGLEDDFMFTQQQEEDIKEDSPKQIIETDTQNMDKAKSVTTEPSLMQTEQRDIGVPSSTHVDDALVNPVPVSDDILQKEHKHPVTSESPLSLSSSQNENLDDDTNTNSTNDEISNKNIRKENNEDEAIDKINEEEKVDEDSKNTNINNIGTSIQSDVEELVTDTAAITESENTPTDEDFQIKMKENTSTEPNSIHQTKETDNESLNLFQQKKDCTTHSVMIEEEIHNDEGENPPSISEEATVNEHVNIQSKPTDHTLLENVDIVENAEEGEDKPLSIIKEKIGLDSTNDTHNIVDNEKNRYSISEENSKDAIEVTDVDDNNNNSDSKDQEKEESLMKKTGKMQEDINNTVNDDQTLIKEVGKSNFKESTNSSNELSSVFSGWFSSPQPEKTEQVTTTTAFAESPKDSSAPMARENPLSPNSVSEEGLANKQSSLDEGGDGDKKSEQQQSVPQFAIEKFMDQLTRLHTEHENELQESEKRHQLKLTEMQNKINLLEQNQQPSGTGDSKAMQKAMDEKILTACRKIEREFNASLDEVQAELDMTKEQKKSIEKQKDSIENELAKILNKLKEKDGIILKMQQEQESKIEGSKNRAIDLQKQVEMQEKEITGLKKNLEHSKDELESSNEAFNTLKSRVKTVATELKERRAEVRTLNTQVLELSSAQKVSNEARTKLEKQVSEQSKSIITKDDEIQTLTTLQEQLQSTIDKMEETLSQRHKVSDKALASYKKKAQSLLASANARAAAAEQAREEAESDFATARSEADRAIQDAKNTQQKCDQIISKAKEEVEILKKKAEAQSMNVSDLKEKIEIFKSERNMALEDAGKSNKARESLLDELNGIGHDLQDEQEKNRLLSQELSVEKITCKDLRDEVDTLREELQRKANAEFMARQKKFVNNGVDNDKIYFENNQNGLKSNSGRFGEGINGTAPAIGAVGETDGTVLMLQHELQAANEAIKELKETLKNTILENNNVHNQTEKKFSSSGNDNYPSTTGDDYMSSEQGTKNGLQDNLSQSKMIQDNPQLSRQQPASYASNSSRENDSTPLYFALEKQAELSTARDEITRLANLLGEAESDKMEAIDQMLEMKRTLEEGEARLRRYEKLGVAASNGNIGSSIRNQRPGYSQYSFSHHNINMPFNQQQYKANKAKSFEEEDTDEAALSSPADSTVNLEYLKNIMFSFMNSKSLNEKKGLVPVVAAVLELTAEEQRQAIQSLEDSAGITNVGTSLIESLQTKSRFW